MKRIFSTLMAALFSLSLAAVLQTADVKAPPSSPKLIALGKQIYGQQCAACHGPQGRADGEAAYLLYPKPRDLVAGNFRLISTWDGVPTDDDLFNTITRGMPGSAMPSWGHLPVEQRWALVYYVKSLSEKPLTVRAEKQPAADGSGGEGIVRVPPAPPYNDVAKARALELYKDACASCHGATAKGDGAQEQVDAEG